MEPSIASLAVTDLLALVAGFAVGALVIVGVLALRRGPQPVVAAGPQAAPAAPPAALRPGRREPSASAPMAGHPIRVNPSMGAPTPGSGGAPPPPSSPGGAPPTRARLELADGSGVHDLGDAAVTLGRGRDQTLRIHDTRASRAHAVVRRRPPPKSGWEVADTGSANGTLLNGHAIPTGRVAPLRDGDRIGIGGVTIRYHEGAAGPPAGPGRSGLRDEPTRRFE